MEPQPLRAPFGKHIELTKGQFDSVSLAEGCARRELWVATTMICPQGNNLAVTLERQMARASRPLNALAESGRGERIDYVARY